MNENTQHNTENPADGRSASNGELERRIGCIGHDGECCANREQEKIDAARYRWLRDRLAIEDIERIEREFFGEPEEAESIKTDIAVDAAMRSN